MIDERHEELASLYAFDLLEGADRAHFEAALARDPELQSLVCELRNASTALAHTASTPPPPALKERILGSLPAVSVTAASKPRARPAPNLPLLVPWGIAAGLAIGVLWLGQRYFTSRTENLALENRAGLAEVAAQGAQQQLEAERIIGQRQLQDLERQLSAAQSQVAKLTTALKSQSAVAELKITALVSMLQNSPEAQAIAVWDPKKQEGVLDVKKLPALAANQDYQLWVVDPQYINPVDGGVFTVEPDTGAARFAFKADKPIQVVTAFAVTRERKGGVPKAEGPFVLLGK